MTKSFSGKVLVVTGAARGIGAGVARAYVARGGKVALLGLEPERLAALADELGPAAAWWEADARDGGGHGAPDPGHHLEGVHADLEQVHAHQKDGGRGEDGEERGHEHEQQRRLGHVVENALVPLEKKENTKAR